jgi:hypothetical protein
MWRKGPTHQIKCASKVFSWVEGANPPRGVGIWLSECVKGCLKVRMWLGRLGIIPLALFHLK